MPTFGSSNLGLVLKIAYMRNETKSISVRFTQVLVYSLFHTWTFIKTEFLCIWSAWYKHLICSYRNELLNTMESYTDFDSHLQFVCLFRNQRHYIDGLTIKSILYQFVQTNGQSLLLNAITDLNCTSVLPQCKLQQSKITNKAIAGTKHRN